MRKGKLFSEIGLSLAKKCSAHMEEGRDTIENTRCVSRFTQFKFTISCYCNVNYRAQH